MCLKILDSYVGSAWRNIVDLKFKLRYNTGTRGLYGGVNARSK